MKKDNSEEDVDFEPKKSKKNKATSEIVPNRSMRRGKRKQSQEVFVLPQQIPRSEGKQMISFVSYECESVHIILQIPLNQCSSQSFDFQQQFRVQNNIIFARLVKQIDNIICSMTLSQQKFHDNNDITMITNGKYSWLTQKEMITKIIKSSRKSVNKKQWNQLFRFKIHDVISDIFIVLTIRKQQQENQEFSGLINQGNTCYMNSYLQMLFHLKQFRKMVFKNQTKQKDKFIGTLQLLFSKMLKQKKSVSPEQLIKSFGWSKKEVQVQQDAQQFSCLFFEALEKTLGYDESKWGSVRQFFCGQIIHYIQCCNLDYRTQNRQQFYDLQLPIANTLASALDDFVGQQILQGENAYRTLQNGLQQARKGLKLSYLPPILMIQLKRFQFNPYKQTNQKILDKFSYPESISFSPWTTDPQKPQKYNLYSVLVHQGGQASSGHYYAYVSINNSWYRFNDEIVTKVGRQKVLDYNFGGQTSVIEYDPKSMKICTKQIQNKRTAYVLVYIKQSCSEELFSNAMQEQIPHWIEEYNKSKENLEQQKKLRKQSICDLSILYWNHYFLNKLSEGNGLTIKQEIQKSQEYDKLQMIAKNTKMDDWISEIQNKLKGQLFVYIYWLSNERDVLSSAKARQCLYVNDLFKEISDPFLIYLPVYAERQEFIIIIKQFFTEQSQNKLRYADCSKIKKESSFQELYQLMSSKYISDQRIDFYLEDFKLGLIKIQHINTSLLPAPIPAKNQLLIVVIHRITGPEQSLKIHKFYKDEKDSVRVIFKSESNKDQCYQEYLNKDTSAAQLRSLIFDKIKDNYACESQNNIVLKFKIKKNSKHNKEASNTNILSQLIKVDKIVYFSISNLKVEERMHRKQLSFYFREQENAKLSQILQIIIAKGENQQKILKEIFNYVQKLDFFKKKPGCSLRAFLLGKDRNFINDLIEQKGHIISKGQLMVVLQRQKNSIIVIEQYKNLPAEIKIENTVNVLVHHMTKTNQRIGNPRWIQVQRKIKMSKLKYLITEQIQSDTLQFEGKLYNANPVKIRLLAYTKQFGRAIQLPQPQEDQQLFKQQQINVDEQKIEDVEQAKQQRKKTTIEDHFTKSRVVRVAVVHTYIAKGSQLKLNVS